MNKTFCSISLAIRKMQIKTTMSFHLICVKMLLSKKQIQYRQDSELLAGTTSLVSMNLKEILRLIVVITYGQISMLEKA
jgi:hypothetical protein